MRALVLLITAALAVSACGYKGPLYLPGSKPERKKPAAQQPAPAQDEEKETK